MLCRFPPCLVLLRQYIDVLCIAVVAYAHEAACAHHVRTVLQA